MAKDSAAAQFKHHYMYDRVQFLAEVKSML